MSEVSIKLLPDQDDFMNMDKKFIGFIAGLGSGKTFGGALKSITWAIENPGGNGIIISNTFGQLHRVALANIKKMLDDFGIRWKYNSLFNTLSFYDNVFYCCSADNYDIIRGVEVGMFWADEARDFKRECFEVLQGRLRQPGVNKYLGLITSTPKGFNWIYDYFHPSGDKHTDEFGYVVSKTSSNHHLPKGYYESLLKSYDSVLAQQELEAGFVSVGQGKIYYSFDRKNNVKPVKPKDQHRYMIGMDFNINPMTAVVAQCIDDKLRIVSEVYVNSSNTKEVGMMLKEKYGRCQIVPDSTGKRKQTSSAGYSDFDILIQCGHNVVNTSNPFRVDRYNNVNRLLEKGDIIIDDSCKHLIKDLEQLSYKEGTNLPDTSGNLGHISDAIGYLAYYTHPIIVKPKVRISSYA